jgi:hypothetical protein
MFQSMRPLSHHQRYLLKLNSLNMRHNRNSHTLLADVSALDMTLRRSDQERELLPFDNTPEFDTFDRTPDGNDPTTQKPRKS